MKLLLTLLLLTTPALAHSGEHHFEEVHPATISSDAYLTDTVNHGYVTCYGRSNCILHYDGEVRQGRMIVPNPSQHFYRYPYNQFVTVW